MKFTIIQTIIWSIVAIGIVVIFSLPNTIRDWGDNRLKTIFLALLFLVGLGTDFLLRILERSKKYGFVRDERDQFVQNKAMYLGFIILALYICILSFSLYIWYESDKFLPIGWVWFIAYSSIVIANLGTSIVSIVYYIRQGN